jgi:hypothetical protein
VHCSEFPGAFRPWSRDGSGERRAVLFCVFGGKLMLPARIRGCRHRILIEHRLRRPVL